MDFSILFDTIYNSFVGAFNALIGLIYDWGNTALMPLALVLPDLSGDISPVVPFLAFANSWVPVSFGLYLVCCYFVFIGMVALIKWMLGLIPFVN